jgi:uncharacterized protein (DUF1015 family)
LDPMDRELFFQQLAKNFHLQETTACLPVQPGVPLRFGMYHDKAWYHLLPKAHVYEGRSMTGSIDAAILQDKVLAPVFGITDPQTDSRLRYAGGEKAMEEIGAILRSHPDAFVFTLCPLTVDQLMDVADSGEALPPKSSWIDPKVPYGLLFYKHQ